MSLSAGITMGVTWVVIIALTIYCLHRLEARRRR